MMKYLAIIFALASFGWAQGEWVVQNNPYNGDETMSWSDCHFIDSLCGWVMRGVSPFLFTRDGGKSWEERNPPWIGILSPTSLNGGGASIFAVDSLNCWATSAFVVHRTRDAGLHWDNVWTDTERIPLSDIVMFDTLRGIAVGRFGKVLITANGDSWEPTNSGTTRDLRGVCYATAHIAVAVGDSGTMLRTTDSGEHWTKIATGTTKNLMDVQFADSLHGIAVGNYIVLRTSDGGQNWTEASSAAEVTAFDVAYPDTNHAWAIVGDAFFSLDAGNTWERQSIPAIHSLYGISASDSIHVWACGDYGQIFYYSVGPGIKENETIEPNPQLQVYPNPSRRMIKIVYYLPISGNVSFIIYNTSGLLVRRLKIDSEVRAIFWDGKDEQGKLVSQGIYFLRLETAGKTLGCKKVVLLG
jgi:photosystem II stability/assembly factor-like uncharacterized protein